MLDRAVQSLDTDRAKRKMALKNNEPIDPLSPISLPFVGESSNVTLPRIFYPAREVLAYLLRLSASAGNTVIPTPPPSPAQHTSLQPSGPIAIEVKIQLQGIAAWMDQAGPNDTWSFSIQKNGRPMDFATAVVFGRLTGEAERLTPREFGMRLADAAAITYVSGESDEISAVVEAIPLSPPVADPSKEEKSGWI